ncbi:hypothetical protein LBMAG27_11130 [Bacteroidota bacterium]|nr:hypothetical protein LBMAG27_11130 [Bacteroidota bacterium]
MTESNTSNLKSNSEMATTISITIINSEKNEKIGTIRLLDNSVGEAAIFIAKTELFDETISVMLLL